MTIIEILRELDTSGKLKQLLQGGVLSPTFAMYFEMCQEVDRRALTTRSDRRQAVTEVADLFRTSENTVYRAIRTLQPKNP